MEVLVSACLLGRRCRYDGASCPSEAVRALCVLLLWGAAALLRQILEPRVMGRSLGVHPLLNLAAVYAGASLFGATGVIFLPIIVVILKNLLLPEERS
jgi:predicted PurR-regulated permease PerM